MSGSEVTVSPQISQESMVHQVAARRSGRGHTALRLASSAGPAAAAVWLAGRGARAQRRLPFPA